MNLPTRADIVRWWGLLRGPDRSNIEASPITIGVAFGPMIVILLMLVGEAAS